MATRKCFSFISVKVDVNTRPEGLLFSRQVRLVPGGMFLCREATSLSYLPVISAGRQGETPFLAPELQTSRETKPLLQLECTH